MSASFRIFISSTWKDLQIEREAVEKALHRMRGADFAGMEYFGSRPETPKDISLAEVDRSDVYVGIFANRYGSGITEAEYRRARELKIPCLIYLKDENVPVVPAFIERDTWKSARLEDLKRELQDNHTVSIFETADKLAVIVTADLHNLLSVLEMGPEDPPKPAKNEEYEVTVKEEVAVGNQESDRTSQPSVKNTSGRDPDTAELYRQLVDQYNLEEMHTLCFRLGIDFEDLGGAGKSAKAREIVLYMQRRGQLDRLRSAIQQRQK